MTARGTGRLVERELLTPTLGVFRFALDGGVPRFEPGQFLTLGLPVDGKLVWRPFSLASPPEETRFVEFLVRWVVHPVGGRFTSQLGSLIEGEAIHWRGPKGHFTMREALPDGSPDRRLLLLVAAGTGVAPFVSYIEHLSRQDAQRDVVLLHGASYVDELAYRRRFEELASDGWLRYVPSVSRPLEEHNRNWSGATGRVGKWLETKPGTSECELERELALRLAPEHTFVHLCGSGGMVEGARAELEARGFRSHRAPHADGHIDLAWEAYG